MNDNPRILLVDSQEIISRYLREKLIIDGGYSVSLELKVEDAVGTFK